MAGHKTFQILTSNQRPASKVRGKTAIHTQYEYNTWYNHCVLVAVRYAGQDGTGSILTCIPDGH
jgi:hypothetical protein